MILFHIELKSGREFNHRFGLIGTAGGGESVTATVQGFNMRFFRFAAECSTDKIGCVYTGEETVLSIPVSSISEAYIYERPRKRGMTDDNKPKSFVEYGWDNPDEPDYDQAMAMANHGYEG